MQAPYHHRPVSRPVVVSFIAMTALLATPFFFAGLHMALFAAVAPVFAMTVEVSGRELSWHFGPGFWRKRIVLSDIAYVRHVRLPWQYGIGIKYTQRAWVYLVAPGDGIEIRTLNGATVRIGTDDAERFIRALASC